MTPFMKSTIEHLDITISLVATQRNLAVQALKNILRVDTLEEARSVAQGVVAAIEVCENAETITITTKDYSAVVEEGDAEE